jgi:Bacterial protein of unknown function (DUF839)
MVFLCMAAAATFAIASTTVAFAGDKSGFKTSRPAFMKPGDMAGVQITPLLTVGDTLSNGYRFESIPDGISLRRKGQDRVEAFVNHETGKVPFPWNVNGGNKETNAENDFDNSQVSKLTLSQATTGVLSGSFAIGSELGYQRFCSNYLATRREDFSRPILFTNEESPDYVWRQEDSWPPLPIGHPDEKEAGLVIAYDPASGKQTPIHGMGRHNHENSVPIPGYGKPVVLSGDDTFTSGPLTGVAGTPNQLAQSQLYSYIAKNTNSVLKDRGDLWAFVSDNPAIDDYYDIQPGSSTQVSGHFIKVPRNIATGLNPDGSEIQAEDVGYPEPPANGSWQPEPRWQMPAPAPGVDGPQWVLNHWSDVNNVFQFVRVEDIAYDKRPGMGNVVYIADSGRGRTAAQSLDTPFRSTNGRIWKMVFDEDDPTEVASLSVFVEGDDNPVKTPNEIHQPDNLETTPNGLLVTEDPGSSQQFLFGPNGEPPSASDPNATTARLWHVPIAGEAGKAIAASVDQSEDEGSTDVDDRPAPSAWGAWESTGVVDASSWFGSGAFLINVQAHTLWIEKALGEDNFAPVGPDFMYKREGGQLLLIRIPGG